MKPPLAHQLHMLQTYAEQLGYSTRIVDDYANTLLEVSNGKTRFLAHNGPIGTYPLNSQWASQLVKDKAWTYLILEQAGFNVPQSGYFFLDALYQEYRGDGKERQDAFPFAESLGYPVFAKPNTGTTGAFAQRIDSPKQLEAYFTNLPAQYPVAIVQELITAPEYRLFVIDGEIKFFYQRIPARITGDGSSSIADLVERLNERITKQSSKIDLKSPETQRYLKEKGLTASNILANGEQVQLLDAANISRGGTIDQFSTSPSPALRAWIKEISDAIPLRVYGLDAFIPNLQDLSSAKIIELNSNPHLLSLEQIGEKALILEVYREVLEKYFAQAR